MDNSRKRTVSTSNYVSGFDMQDILNNFSTIPPMFQKQLINHLTNNKMTQANQNVNLNQFIPQRNQSLNNLSLEQQQQEQQLEKENTNKNEKKMGTEQDQQLEKEKPKPKQEKKQQQQLEKEKPQPKRKLTKNQQNQKTNNTPKEKEKKVYRSKRKEQIDNVSKKLRLLKQKNEDFRVREASLNSEVGVLFRQLNFFREFMEKAMNAAYLDQSPFPRVGTTNNLSTSSSSSQQMGLMNFPDLDGSQF
ncbi:raftlin [Anaeramoeba flamelloides]|uniref:Raftlin n=1 Tax=Anaeramoeba flamelloides TaxID=1746091 RepID=A0AAV7ZPP0_9EUKA|nr:raftlin [Anaeramoeba flamelloides]